MKIRMTTLAGVAAAALMLCLLSGCAELTPYGRTLPDRIERIYVPMAQNKTYEPGLEELVTKGFATEVLADGRLSLDRKNRADAVVQIFIEQYSERTDDFQSDDIERDREIEMILSASLFERNDLENPFARIDTIPVRVIYRSDFRSTQSIPDVDAREMLGETAGRSLLHHLMNRNRPVEP